MKENFRAHRSSSRNPGGVSQVTRKTLYATVAVAENTVETLLLDFVAEIMAIVQNIVQQFMMAKYGPGIRVPNLIGNDWTLDSLSGSKAEQAVEVNLLIYELFIYLFRFHVGTFKWIPFPFA